MIIHELANDTGIGGRSHNLTRQCEICDRKFSVYTSHSRAACAARTKRALVEAQTTVAALRTENASQALRLLAQESEIQVLNSRLGVYGALGAEEYEVNPEMQQECPCCGITEG